MIIERRPWLSGSRAEGVTREERIERASDEIDP
jgi:hypothetical protein